MSSEKRISIITSLFDQLSIPPSQRTQSDIDQIYRLTSNFKFFQDLTEKEDSPKLHIECCKVLTVQSFPKSEYICKRGDPGTAFYLILHGSVAVLSNDNDLLEKEEFKNQLEDLLTDSTPLKAFPELQLDPSDKTKEKEIAILNAGHSFGEMALIHDRPRYFSVKCLESTVLAVLHKNDYQIIAKVHEKQINEKIEFIRGMGAFRSWTKIAVQKLSYFFKNQSFNKGNVVYKEGDPPTDVYIIKHGEFIFTQSYSFDAGFKAQAESFGTLTRRKIENIVKKKNLNVVIKQKGEFFGYNEIVENLPGREFTCTCSSVSGELLVITEKNFGRKIVQPETLKFIEQSCARLREWLSPRIQRLKETEKVKDSISFTPLNRIKILRNKSPDVKFPVLYSPAPMKKTTPTVLEKFLNSSRNRSDTHRRVRMDQSAVFHTEGKRERIVRRRSRVNYSVVNHFLTEG